MNKTREIIKNMSIEDTWRTIKNTIIQTAKEVCGCTKINKTKRTRWWNEEIKKEVQLKKQEWKRYLGERNSENYNRYKKQRLKVKELVKTAKQQSWEEFGEKLERDSKGNQKLFYRVLKTLRKGKQNRSRCIYSANGKLLEEEDDIMERWREYFAHTLNRKQQIENKEVGEMKGPIECDAHLERDEIKKEEIIEAVKRLKRGKAAGHDQITTEMVKNMDKNVVFLSSLVERILMERFLLLEMKAFD